jgi:hypothetical protein
MKFATFLVMSKLTMWLGIGQNMKIEISKRIFVELDEA